MRSLDARLGALVLKTAKRRPTSPAGKKPWTREQWEQFRYDFVELVVSMTPEARASLARDYANMGIGGKSEEP